MTKQGSAAARRRLRISDFGPRISDFGTRVPTAPSLHQAAHKALDAFEEDTGRYPTTAEGLGALVMPPDCEGWNGPYLERMLTDKWGTPYRYTCLPPAADWFFELRSAGHDQTFGTRDDIIYQP